MNTKQKIIAFNSILSKEIVRFVKIWPQTLLPSVITVTLYFIVFGYVIGSQIKSIDGFSYMQYIAPGLIMMAVITNTYANVTTSFYGARIQKSIEELLTAPISSSSILLGYALGGVLRGLVVAILVTIVSVLFTHLPLKHLFVAILVIVLTSTFFSLAALTNSIFAKKYDDISLMSNFIIVPLIYLGGVFYSIKLLPPFWQDIALLNPILYMINALRKGFLGVSDISIYIAFSVLLIFITFLFLLNLFLLKRGVCLKN